MTTKREWDALRARKDNMSLEQWRALQLKLRQQRRVLYEPFKLPPNATFPIIRWS